MKTKRWEKFISEKSVAGERDAVGAKYTFYKKDIADFINSTLKGYSDEVKKVIGGDYAGNDWFGDDVALNALKKHQRQALKKLNTKWIGDK